MSNPLSLGRDLLIKHKKNAFENVNILEEFHKDPKYKTEMCKSWQSKTLCVYGNKCRFAHGRHELFDKSAVNKKFKQKQCLSFYKFGYCLYGSRCHFKHNDTVLREINRSFYSYLLNAYQIFRDNINLKVDQGNTVFDKPDLNNINICNYNTNNSMSLSFSTNDTNLAYKIIGKNLLEKRLDVFCNITSSKGSSICLTEDSYETNSLIFCQSLVAFM